MKYIALTGLFVLKPRKQNLLDEIGPYSMKYIILMPATCRFQFAAHSVINWSRLRLTRVMRITVSMAVGWIWNAEEQKTERGRPVKVFVLPTKKSNWPFLGTICYILWLKSGWTSCLVSYSNRNVFRKQNYKLLEKNREERKTEFSSFSWSYWRTSVKKNYGNFCCTLLKISRKIKKT